MNHTAETPATFGDRKAELAQGKMMGAVTLCQRGPAETMADRTSNRCVNVMGVREDDGEGGGREDIVKASVGAVDEEFRSEVDGRNGMDKVNVSFDLVDCGGEVGVEGLGRTEGSA